MELMNIATKTGRGLAATAAIAGVLSFAAPPPAQARISTGAAVGIGLGAFALGSALSAGAYPYYSPYYSPYSYGYSPYAYGYGYSYAPAYSYYAPAPYYGGY